MGGTMSTRDTMHPSDSCDTRSHCIALRRIAAAIALTGAGLVQSAEFSATEFYGDSLTDSGTYAPFASGIVPGSGKYTTNPGPVWSEDLAVHYQRSAIPNA